MNSEICLPFGQEICSLEHAKKKKICSRVCCAAASESVHKRDGLHCSEVPFQGFPLRAEKKNHWEGEAGQPSEFQPTHPKECFIFPRGESMEAVGKGSTSSPKKGLFGNHLIF